MELSKGVGDVAVGPAEVVAERLDGVGEGDGAHGGVVDGAERVRGVRRVPAHNLRRHPRRRRHEHHLRLHDALALGRVVRQRVPPARDGVNLLQLPVDARVLLELLLDGVREHPQPFAERPHRLPHHLWQVGIHHRRVRRLLLHQLERPAHDGPALLLERRNLPERRLHPELGRVASVHARAERLDQAVVHLVAEVALDELLHRLLHPLRRRRTQPDGAQPRPNLPRNAHQVEERQVQQTCRHRSQLLVPPHEPRGTGVTQNQVILEPAVHRHSKDGRPWLEAVGTVLPEEPFVVGHGGDVPADALARLSDEETLDGVLLGRADSLGGAQAGEPPAHDDAVEHAFRGRVARGLDRGLGGGDRPRTSGAAAPRSPRGAARTRGGSHALLR
mmetsp:Transcript_19192/g.62506  ORF Transcript_19192/g.62506 Transcript_19192/m.62506 type:complete len:389 (-) Transcript_19192:29-1195(-)